MSTSQELVNPRHMMLLENLAEVFAYSVKGSVTLHPPTIKNSVYWIEWQHTIEKDGEQKPVWFYTAFRDEDLRPEVFDPIYALVQMRSAYIERIDGHPNPGASLNSAILITAGQIEYTVTSNLPDDILDRMEKDANVLLTVNGHVFLNQVYEGFGMLATPAGQIIGWKWQGGPGHIRFERKQLVPNNPGKYVTFKTDGVIVHLI